MGNTRQDTNQKLELNMDEIKENVSKFLPAKVFDHKLVSFLNYYAQQYEVFDTEKIRQAIFQSIDIGDEVNLKELHNHLYELYLLEDTPAKARQAILNAKENNPQLTKEEQFQIYLEHISPTDYLLEKTGAITLPEADDRLIRSLLINMRLKPGVANVLLDYVLLLTDMKLAKGFTEKIASHWARKKVQTVKEAMALAKKEYEQRKSLQKPRTTQKTLEIEKTISDEITGLPDTDVKIKEALHAWITKQFRTISQKAKSPTEILLAIQLLQEKGVYEYKLNTTIQVYQQKMIEDENVDFLIKIPQHSLNVIVECEDNQAKEAEEKARLEKLQSLGFYVFHYTSSDIYTDASACTREIWAYIEEKLNTQHS